MNYPRSLAEVYYLTRKEVRQRDDIPALSLDDIRVITNLFWKQIKELMSDSYDPIKIPGLFNFLPVPKAIKRYKKALEAQKKANAKKKEKL